MAIRNSLTILATLALSFVVLRHLCKRGRPMYWCVWNDERRGGCSAYFLDVQKAQRFAAGKPNAVIHDTQNRIYESPQPAASCLVDAWPNAGELFSEKIGDVQPQ